MDCCTVATVRQVAAVRVLAESFRRHHPGRRVFAVFLDDIRTEIGGEELFTALRVADLDVGARHFHRLALLNEEPELARAIMPLLVRAALERAGGNVAYLDPETLVLGSLTCVDHALEGAPIVLVPYVDAAIPCDARTPASHDLLVRPAVDLGFIGFSQAAGPILDWWWGQMAVDRRVARGEPPEPDPLVANRIPLLFEHEILHEPHLTVGYWNAFARRIEVREASYEVAGKPLLTFRFVGFDHRQPWLLSAYQGARPRVLLSENPAIARLCETYAARLRAREADLFAGVPYGYSRLPGGVPVDLRMRRLAAEALAASTTLAGLPDAFDREHANAFVRWLRSPAHPGGPPRYLGELAATADPSQLVERAIAGDMADGDLPVELIPPPASLGGDGEHAGVAGDPLVEAKAWLLEGALTPWDEPSRFGPAGRLWRRLLRRALRPYEVRQREFQRAVVDAVTLRDHRLEMLRAYLRILRESLDKLCDWEVAVRHGDAPKAVAARRALQRRITALRDRLEPELYLGDPAALRATDDLERVVMGFVRPDAGPVDPALDFLATFRGPETRVRDLQRYYIETVLRGHGPVLDIGCGRGELLDLLREAGIEGFGVESSRALVEHCRAKGHRAELGDGLELLESQAGGSLGAVFAAQVIEHLPHDRHGRLFELARKKLRGDGVLVVETLNPHSLQVLTTFWVDPSHTGPVFPEVALSYCRAAGFAAARIVFPAGTGDLETDLRAQNEYAVVASGVPSEIGLRAADSA